MIKGIIFDLDGTLVDSLVDLADSMNRILTRYKYPLHTLQAYQYFIGSGIRNLVREALPPEAREEALIARCFEEMMEDYGEHCTDKTKPYPEITNLLEELSHRKIQCSVLSNKVDHLTQKVVATCFPKQRFEVIIGSGQDMPRKPNPQGAIFISNTLQIPTSELLFVGDTGIDMETAHNARITSVGVLWGYRTKEELAAKGAQYLIGKPGELLDLLG